MLRLVKIALVVLVGLWNLLSGITNLVGYDTGHGFVELVMAREGASPGSGPFIAMAHPVLTHVGYAVVWLGKLAAAAFCLWGAARMWASRGAPAEAFSAAKSTALAGCGIALAMLFGGFFVAGGAYFAMWSSQVGLASHDIATQYLTGIGLIALFVAAKDN